jgi:hypothetical protein
MNGYWLGVAIGVAAANGIWMTAIMLLRSRNGKPKQDDLLESEVQEASPSMASGKEPKPSGEQSIPKTSDTIDRSA